MRSLRSILVGIIILAVMFSSFASASVDEKTKENGKDAIVYLMKELNVQDPDRITGIFSCGWFDYVFKIKRSENSAEETFRVSKEDADHPWEYKSVQMKSNSVVEGKNMTVFNQWDSEAFNWLIEELEKFGSLNTEVNAEDTPAASKNEKADSYQILQKGSKGDGVIKLQNRLNELGYSVGKADGDYGNKTKAAVEQFQADNGLEKTGIADEKTQKALYLEEAKSSASADKESSRFDPEIVKAGIEFISDVALEETADFWNMSKSVLWVGEVYCEDKGNNVYQFSARVYRDGFDKGMGFGERIAFSKDSKGSWTGEADNKIVVYTLNNTIPGELVWSKAQADDTTSSGMSGETDEASLIAAGTKYISNSVMEIAPALLGVPEKQCRITEIYYLDKGDNEYRFTARVSRGGPGGYGIGKDLTITPKSDGGWDISDSNHITMYGGRDTIPGDMIFGDVDEASLARGMQVLGDELKKLDVNGDGELSMDEIFDMK